MKIPLLRHAQKETAMLKRSYTLVSVLIFILIMVTPAFSQIPRLINYQGYLTDGTGDPISGSRKIQFIIYNEEVGGSNIWTETQKITINEGVFSVLLGTENPIPQDVFDGSDKYLALKIDPDLEMTPRKRLVSVGYAYYAAEADKLDGNNASAFIKTVDGVAPASGDVDLVAGANISITHPGSNQIEISASGTGGGGVWSESDGNVYPADSEYKVGIGDPTPTHKLDVAGKIGINDTQAIYLPDQGEFLGTLFVGTGGGSITKDISGGGFFNTGLGIEALHDITTGYWNTASGYRALRYNTTGSFNVASGCDALFSNTTGRYNTASGYGALFYNTIGSSNMASGSGALGANTTGNYNTASGDDALRSNTTGDGNTASGYFALHWNNSGSRNIGIGGWANYNNRSGSNNTIIGYEAGRGENSHDKSGNVFIGYRAGYYETRDNRLYIENSDTTSPLIWGNFNFDRVVINGNGSHNTHKRTFYVNGDAGGTGDWHSDSDARLKKDIATIPEALEKVMQLRGVNFKWKDTEHHEEGIRMGFIAQEAVEIIPEVVSQKNDHYTMQYASVTALLVEAVKEQQIIIGILEERIKDLENR